MKKIKTGERQLFAPKTVYCPGQLFFFYYFYFFSVNEQKIFEWNQWLKIEFSQLNLNLNKVLGKPKHKTVKELIRKNYEKRLVTLSRDSDDSFET